MNLMEKLWRPRALNAMTDVVQPAPVTKARFKDGLRYALVVARDLLLPPVCPVCREPVAGAGGLCAHCWAKLSFIARPYCERLGTPFTHDMGAGVLSVRAIADPPAYGRARAAVRYDEIARALVVDGASGQRTANRRRCNRSGAAALASPLDQAIQSGGATRRGDLPVVRTARLACCTAARPRDVATSRTFQDRARGKCAGRIPRPGRKQGDNPRQAYRAG